MGAFFMLFVGPVSAAPPGNMAGGAALTRPTKGHKKGTLRVPSAFLNSDYFLSLCSRFSTCGRPLPELAESRPFST